MTFNPPPPQPAETKELKFRFWCVQAPLLADAAVQMLAVQLLLLCYQIWEEQLKLLRLDSFVLPPKKSALTPADSSAPCSPESTSPPEPACVQPAPSTRLPELHDSFKTFSSAFFFFFCIFQYQHHPPENTRVQIRSGSVSLEQEPFSKLLWLWSWRISWGAAQMKGSALGTLIWRCALWLQTHI